jgi:exopolysaccharide biosynthesis polyprenyl glycosylphosphotransferase
VSRSTGAEQATAVPGAPALEAQRAPSLQRAREKVIAHRHGKRDYVLRRVLALADALGLVGAGLIAFSFAPAVTDHSQAEALLLIPLLPVWLILLRTYGLYDRDIRISRSVLDDLPAFFHVFVIGTLLTWIYYRLLPVHQLVLVEVLLFNLSGVLLICVLRTAGRRLVTRAFGFERALVIGSADRTENLIRKIQKHPEYALEPIGVLAVPSSSGGNEYSLEVLGELGPLGSPAPRLDRLFADQNVERMIVAGEGLADGTLLDLVQQGAREGVKVSILPSHVQALGPALEVDSVEGVTVLGLKPLVLPRFSRILKRSVDVVGAGTALVLAAPFLALIAVAIKLDSKGPVLFRQRRIGKGGKSFTLRKFRTMETDAEARVGELRKQSEDPHWLKLERDPRITRVGSALRLMSLDELPQLWNVLKGEMSLVGPRPLIGSEDELVEEWARIRLDLSPGITGLWQVQGRTNIPFEEMVKLDYIYVTNWSLWLDLKLILHTIPAVLSRNGAN